MVQQAAEVTLCISERLRLSSGHIDYGSAARPLRPPIKDGNNLITYPIGLLQLSRFCWCSPRLQPLNEYSLLLTHCSMIHKSMLSWTIYRLV